MQIDRAAIEELNRIYRLNLINAITGIKPVNLIGTRSSNNEDNLAIFSSIVHLGSSPAQIGFILRPSSDVPRDTYSNILETGYYTINHVSESFVKQAHYTSAKLDKNISEFEVMNIEREFINDFHAPFVKNSAVKLGMKFIESIPLPNGCDFICGSVEMITAPDDAINKHGQLDLEAYACTGLSGLDTYYSLKKLESFPYVHVNEIPDFK
jgi:flavin reductase (DIM6/NTAB) family NADH-FMN oxidoreductase RutF